MPDDLETVATFSYVTQANMAKALLDGAGIPASLLDDKVNADWLLGSTTGWVKLQVAASQAAAAKELLAEQDEQIRHSREISEEAEADDRPDAIRCLSCNAEIPEGVTACPACGWTYQGDAAT